MLLTISPLVKEEFHESSSSREGKGSIIFWENFLACEPSRVPEWWAGHLVRLRRKPTKRETR